MEYQRERERESVSINLLRTVQLSFILAAPSENKCLKPNNNTSHLFSANTALFVSGY
jgi:hypothetical protein